MSTNSVHWNNDLIYKLIELYKDRPFLWDTSMKEYKDRVKKAEAWLDIAKQFDADRDAVERKMKILLTQFRREVFKVGDESRWFAYQKLLFMKPRIEKLLRNSATVIEIPDYEGGATESNSREDTTPKKPVSESTSSKGGILAFQPYSNGSYSVKQETNSDDDQSTSRSSRKRSWSPSEPDKTEEMYKLLQEMHTERTFKDEYTVFGEHVAAKLRKLDNLYSKCTAQYHINNILYKAEIGEYDDDKA